MGYFFVVEKVDSSLKSPLVDFRHNRTAAILSKQPISYYSGDDLVICILVKSLVFSFLRLCYQLLAFIIFFYVF